MIVSINEIMGSLIYRTYVGLNKNQVFLDGLVNYEFRPTIMNNGKLHLWHYPGTIQEISSYFQFINKDTINGSKLKFPAFLNYQNILQRRAEPGKINIYYNLAIVSPVHSFWTTQERDESVFRRVLRPIYEEFVKQVMKSEYINITRPFIAHDYMEVYTTGQGLSETIMKSYGDFMDAIELSNLMLLIDENMCDKWENQIREESKKVTDEIKNIKDERKNTVSM